MKSLQQQRQRRRTNTFWLEKPTRAFGLGELKKLLISVYISLMLREHFRLMKKAYFFSLIYQNWKFIYSVKPVILFQMTAQNFYKFGWKLPSNSGGDDFSNSSMYFHYFVISPYEKDRTLYLLNLNPFTQGCFVKRVVEIDLLIYFRNFVMISPWKRALYFIKLESPLPKNHLFQVWSNLALGFGWENEHVKNLQKDGQTDRRTNWRTTDNRRSKKLTWALLRWAKNEFFLNPFCKKDSVESQKYDNMPLCPTLMINFVNIHHSYVYKRQIIFIGKKKTHIF